MIEFIAYFIYGALGQRFGYLLGRYKPVTVFFFGLSAVEIFYLAIPLFYEGEKKILQKWCEIALSWTGILVALGLSSALTLISVLNKDKNRIGLETNSSHHRDHRR